MSTLRILLNSYGLNRLKPLQVLHSPFETQTAQTAPRFDTGREQLRVSMLGTPIVSDLILSYGEQIFTFDVALIELTGRKNIVETTIQGRDGSVKEFIANADKAINIKAILYSEQPDNYPIELVRSFEELMQVNDTLNCISPVFDIFGITGLVVKDYKIRQTEGQMNIVPVDITAIEDKYLDILVNA